MHYTSARDAQRLFRSPYQLGLGAIPANESIWQLSTGQLTYPDSGGSVLRTYAPPALVAPKYADLPVAPHGSQGSIDFPWPIQEPAYTGNYFWWNGSAVLNIGYPIYANDCWEFLRFALVDSDFESVAQWL